MQDSKGYMWFATDRGVCRFDGYQFKTFTTSNGLADNTIFECKEDYKGRIWFRSFSGRLSYYYHDSIYKIPINDSLVKLMKTSFNTSIAIDSTDNLYIGYYAFKSGFIKINLKRNTISTVPLPEFISYVIKTSGGDLLTGNTNPFLAPLEGKAVKMTYLALYSLQPGGSVAREVKKWKWDDFGKNQVHDASFFLSGSRIVTTLTSNFIVLDTSKSSFVLTKRYPESILNINSGANNSGWIILANSIEYFHNDTILARRFPYFLIKHRVTSITEDKEGGTWFTTLYGGVYYVGSLNFKTFSEADGLPGNKINALTVTKDGTIWTASEHSNKLAVIHSDSISYRTLPDREGLSVNNILITKKEVWVGTTSGVFSIFNNPPYSISAGNTGINAYEILPNPDGTFWANTYSYMSLLKKEAPAIKPIKSIYLYSKIFAVCRDPDQSLWLGTLKGLLKLRNDSIINFTEGNHLLTNRIDGIAQAENGDLWLATRDTGIIVKQGNKLTHITTQNGLMSNFCDCACFDYKGNVWVGSNIGISHIMVNKNSTGRLVDTIYNISAPNLIDVNKIAANGDSIYAATGNGLTVFNMNMIRYNKMAPPVYVTNIKINNSSAPLDTLYNLSYDENYFVISFVGLTYKDAGNTSYRYKMEGIDTGWLYTKNRDVQYPKVAPGNYKFLVSAMNNDGVWNQHAAVISLNITPPFWATWWARTLFVLVVIGFIYWRFKLLETRSKKDAETNKQILSMELRELRAQMDPHFLFNNLNTLTHLVELKSDDAPEFVDELSKYYRYSLQFRNSEFTTLENELKQAERYITILRIRFGDHMKITWNINETFKQYYIATYSLQLLLENITKHNIVSAT